MPNEFEEIQPAAEEPEGAASSEPVEPAGEPQGDAADTISGDLAPLEGVEDAGAVDVSDTMAESSVVSGQEEAPGGAMIPRRAQANFVPLKPRSNIFTLLLILSFMFIGLAIYLLALELNSFYNVTFGGILSEPNKTAETTETGR